MVLEALRGYSWREAFGFAGEPGTQAKPSEVIIEPCLPGSDVSLNPFTREDVVEIHGILEGSNDEDPWRIYGRLQDGRHFYLEAWCDYTGWD